MATTNGTGVERVTVQRNVHDAVVLLDGEKVLASFSDIQGNMVAARDAYAYADSVRDRLKSS